MLLIIADHAGGGVTYQLDCRVKSFNGATEIWLDLVAVYPNRSLFNKEATIGNGNSYLAGQEPKRRKEIYWGRVRGWFYYRFYCSAKAALDKIGMKAYREQKFTLLPQFKFSIKRNKELVHILSPDRDSKCEVKGKTVLIILKRILPFKTYPLPLSIFLPTPLLFSPPIFRPKLIRQKDQRPLKDTRSFFTLKNNSVKDWGWT